MLAMAGSVGTTPAELSKGMYLIESAGYHAATGLSVLHAAAEGAKVGAADLRVVADGLTTAMTDYHFPASQAADVTSKLIATVGAGKTTLGDLSGAMANVLPFAAALGIGFDNVLGAMATMTSRGIGADQAATMLKFTIMSLSNETPKGVKALDSIGISTQQLTDDLKNKGLSGTLAEITDALGKKFPKGSAEYNHALAAIVGGTRGMGATLALTGGNAKTFTDNIKTISGATAEAGGHVKGFALTEETLAEKMDMAKASVAAMAIKLGNDLLPAASVVMDFFNNTAMPALKDFGGFIMGTVVPAIQNFAKGFQDGTGPAGRFKDLLTLIYTDAVKPLADFITGTALPAIKNFTQGFADGTGPGGTLRDILKDVYDKALVPLATFITGTALPALKSIETWITGTGLPAIGNLITRLLDSKDTLEKLASFIGIILIPVFADMAAKAVISAVTQAGAWVSTQVAGVTSALSQLGSHYIVVAGWVMSTAKAVASGITTAIVWGMYKADAIAGAATTVGSLLVVAAGWVSSAATAMASAVVMAAAWVVGLGPVAWVVVGIGLLIAAIVAVAVKTTWFQTAWEYATGAIGKAWQWVWNGVLAPVFRMVMDGLGSILGGISNMLMALSHIPGFGWAKDAADSMRGASDQAHALANGIKDIPDTKHITITISAQTVGSLASTYASQVPKFAVGTNYAPGGMALVGELGPELVNLPRGSQVIPNNQIGAAGSGSNADLLAEVQGLRADIRNLPRDYQMGARQYA